MADFYALREEELRLDDDLSSFYLPLFYFSLFFEKTREKVDYGECYYVVMQSFSCHLKSCEHTNFTASGSDLLLAFCNSSA